MEANMNKEKISKILDELTAEPYPFRALLRRYDLSQSELAGYMSVCQTAVSKWCKLTPALSPHNFFNLYIAVLIMEDTYTPTEELKQMEGEDNGKERLA